MPENPGKSGKLNDPEWLRQRAHNAAVARTTPEYHLDRVRDFVARSRSEQGLEPLVVDDLTLGQAATLLGVSAHAD